MKHSANNDWLDKALSKAFDPEMREPDFQKWLAAHPDAAEKLRKSAQKNKNDIRAYRLWRTIMKSRITKLAAAAVIIITIGLLAYYHTGSIDGTSVAWGDVVKPILNARTAILDIIVGSGENRPVIHDEVMGSRIRRTTANVESTDIIIDLEQQKILALDHTKKTAVFIGLGGLDNLKNYVEVLRDTIVRFQDKPDFHVENKGLQKIDSRDCIVFVADSNNQTITIWADPKTALPIRIEQKTPNMQITCDNMQFDVALDESRFSMEVPPDYQQIQNTGIDFKKSSESDFIETLRIWVEIIEERQFPDSIDLADIVKIGPKFDQGLKRANLTEQQQVEVATRWGQGLVFIRFFKGQGQWHYAGKGVKLGDSNEPIFWYQPQNSQTWRVIYGDLTVEDVNHDELTKLEADSAARILRYDAQPKPVTEAEGRQIDKWHLTISRDIAAHCSLTIDKILTDAVKIVICLPYAAGKLQSAKIGEDELPYNDLGKGKYELTLPANWTGLDNKTIEVAWTIPLDLLDRGAGGFRTELSGLIPLTSYSLDLVLDDGCGYENMTDASLRQTRPFWGNAPKATMRFGTCGLMIQKSK
jgi:hypothetical protein